MIDEKGRLFGKINIIDLIVVLLVVAALAGVGFNYVYSKNTKVAPGVRSLFYNNAEAVPVEYIIRVQNVRSFTSDALAVGDMLYDSTTKTALGRVTKVDVRPYEDFIVKTTGEHVRSAVPERYEVHLVVEFDGIEHEGEFSTAANLKVARGATMKFMTGKVATSGTVLEVGKTEKKK